MAPAFQPAVAGHLHVSAAKVSPGLKVSAEPVFAENPEVTVANEATEGLCCYRVSATDLDGSEGRVTCSSCRRKGKRRLESVVKC